MHLAVISDIHGNCFALDRALEDIRRQGIEQIVCLGDAIQGGAQPAETVQRLRELNCPIVMGNADDWLLTGRDNSPSEPSSEQQLTVRDWSLAHLSAEDLAFIQQFQPSIEITLEGGQKLLCFHGSPHSYNDIILPTTEEETLHQFLGGFDATLLAGGHTHTQQWRALDDAHYLNPGSISLPYSWRFFKRKQPITEHWANYAIISSEGEMLSITFRRVPFDIVELARIIRASGRPYAEEAIATYQQKA